MNLIIDIGNTSTKIAVIDNSNIIFNTRFEKLEISDIQALITKYEINKCILSSTVKLNENYKNIFDTNGIKILYFNHKTKIPIKNLYHSPETLGMDRLASVIGAYNKHPQNNILVIDMGTAITYDFINSNGEYLGGNISPGINMRLNALNHYTSKLPLIQKEGAVAELGYNTETAIRSGVLNGIKHEINGFINSLKVKYSNLFVFLTGGDTLYFDSSVKNCTFVNDFLVIEGLNTVLEYVNENDYE